MARTEIAILGAGPAGIGAAWQLAVQKKARVIVLEQNNCVGGNAGSFELAGLNVDYGSHRLHPACEPNILNDLRKLLGGDLLERPRKGRIRLRGRWIHFPLKPQDLVMHLPFAFGAGIAFDAVKKLGFSNRQDGHETFTNLLERGLGSTICRDFYFPYAKKIWGLPPERLSATQARRRVSAGSMGKMAKKLLTALPGLKPVGAGVFYYPRRGFGQIVESIAAEASRLGVEIKFESSVRKIQLGGKHKITYESKGDLKSIEADHIWSTIPLTVLSKTIEPPTPVEVFNASEHIKYRAMVLIYLVLDQEQWTPFDAHYFPEGDIKLTRLSEPKNYSASAEPLGRTVLCGELPCTVGDDVWNASDDELGQLVRQALKHCGLPIGFKILDIKTKRLPFAYPIYEDGYEQYFDVLDKWANGLKGVLTFGRQGLFAHDNTHHALAMSYAAVDCLGESGEFDSELWSGYRAEFSKHVVED